MSEQDAGAPGAQSPAEQTVTADERRTGWLGLAVAGLFGVFYAYDLWEAIGNLVNLPTFYAAFGLDEARLPWWLLWAGVLIPPVAFAAALLLGRRHSLLGQALVLLTGLAVVAALSLGVIALEQVLRP